MGMISRIKDMFVSKSNNEAMLFEEIQAQLIKDNKQLFIGELLQRACRNYPDKEALICRDKSITYKDFYFRAVAFSKKLSDKGVVAKDHVLLYYENSFEFYIAYWATLQLGAVIIPLNIFNLKLCPIWT